MAPYSSTLAWKTPWMEEPGGLPKNKSYLKTHSTVWYFMWYVNKVLYLILYTLFYALFFLKEFSSQGQKLVCVYTHMKTFS